MGPRTIELDLDRLMAGRLLIQGSSGAGKSATLRKIVEEAFDYLTVMIVDPEGEFGNLAAHIGATTIRGAELTTEGLTAAAVRGRIHRINLHLDLTDLDPEQRILRASAFLSGLISVEREHWENTVLLAIDEAHLLAPFVAGSARDAETRRVGVATLTDICARGRKRGIAPVIATQRLAKLAASVTSELQNFLVGINVFDRDIARAADLLGFDRQNAERFRTLQPGEFFAMGPALCPRAELVKVHRSITPHLGRTPGLRESVAHGAEQALALLDLVALQETAAVGRDRQLVVKGRGAVDAFLMDPHAVAATRVVAALKQIAPSATTATDLGGHLNLPAGEIDDAIDILLALGAVDAMPRGEGRIARLHARLRQRLTDVKVVGLS
ncbi:MAG: DUF87 domain-containing protein [Novosphingobium sp.]